MFSIHTMQGCKNIDFDVSRDMRGKSINYENAWHSPCFLKTLTSLHLKGKTLKRET